MGSRRIHTFKKAIKKRHLIFLPQLRRKQIETRRTWIDCKRKVRGEEERDEGTRP